MTALIAAIFLASVVGSPHCAGMCGAFVAIACGRLGGEPAGAAEALRLQFAYHGGRLVTYLTLGGVAGAAGQFLDLAGGLAGLRPLAATLAGATMITFALLTLLRMGGFHLAGLHPPAFLSRWLAPAHRVAMRRTPLARALLIGLLTTLLPCGWLYAFVITAAGTASPIFGAVAMAVFWAGTLPVLVSLGAGARATMGLLGRRLPLVTSVVLVAVGMYTILARGSLDPNAMAQTLQSQTIVPGTRSDSAATLPCCAGEGQ